MCSRRNAAFPSSRLGSFAFTQCVTLAAATPPRLPHTTIHSTAHSTQHNTSHSTKYNTLRTQTTKHTHLPHNTQHTADRRAHPVYHIADSTQHNHSSEQSRQHSTARLPPGSKSPNYSDSNIPKKEPVNCHL